MEQKGFHRKFTSISHTALAGYSRLKLDDEAAKLKTLEAYKQLIPELNKNSFHAALVPACLQKGIVIPTLSKNKNYCSRKRDTDIVK